jgi:hypothetical protein
VTVFEILVTLLVFSRFLVFFLLCFDSPAALSESLGNLLVRGENVRSDEREFVCHVMVVFVSGMERRVLKKFLERLSLAHELDKFGVGGLALVEAVFIFFEKVF